MKKLDMLNKTDEFSSVFSFKKRLTSSFIAIHYLPQQQAVFRVGFVIAKRLVKRAVDRNYMRRVLREICRQQPYLESQAYIVIRVIKPFKHHDYKTVFNEMYMLLNKIQQRVLKLK